jgi:hypothetical protein
MPPVGAPSIHQSHAYIPICYVFTDDVATLRRPEVYTEVETISHHTYQAAQNSTGPTSSQIKTGNFSIGPAPSVYVSCRLAAFNQLHTSSTSGLLIPAELPRMHMLSIQVGLWSALYSAPQPQVE